MKILKIPSHLCNIVLTSEINNNTDLKNTSGNSNANISQCGICGDKEEFKSLQSFKFHLIAKHREVILERIQYLVRLHRDKIGQATNEESTSKL